jgi:ubiquinol-cytochrome c reductase iron-sulfur subunit
VSDADDTPTGNPAKTEPNLPEQSAHLPAQPEEPIDNPGLPAHVWRPTDVDPAKEKRAERQVAALFGLSMLFTVLFVVAYFAIDVGDDWDTFAGLGASNLALGLTLGMALLCIGVGAIQWARKLMSDHEIVEMRHPARSSDEDRAASVEALTLGAQESGIARRPLVRNTLLGAMGLLGVPAIVGLRDLGPTPGQVAEAQDYPGAGLFHTVWTEGMHIVRDAIGTRIRARDLEVGDLVNAAPAILYEPDPETGEMQLEGVEVQITKSKAALILLRMEPEDIKPGKGRENWTVDGIVAYSKICTHVGCPISLNERTTHHLLCPCHQSTFDLADSGKVVFGPAARNLPQLPIMVDDEGYLVAQKDFDEPVGPSFWDRNKG